MTQAEEKETDRNRQTETGRQRQRHIDREAKTEKQTEAYRKMPEATEKGTDRHG